MDNTDAAPHKSGLLNSNIAGLREIYPFDPGTRTFTIPARLERYRDFFNPLDPSPAPARDLAPELVSYLNQCSEEIPDAYPLAIRIEIAAEPRDARREQECLADLRSYYQHETFITQAQIRRRRGQALKYLGVSCLCLALYIFSQGSNLAGFIWSLLREAILIGGWVFMWEAVTLNFIGMDSYLQEIKKFRRLIRAGIQFIYPPSPEISPTGASRPKTDQPV